MDDWEKFNETILPRKNGFYSNLTLEHITDTYYMYARRVCKNFEIKILENLMICILDVIYYF